MRIYMQVFVELGAGKGLLGLAVSCIKPLSTLVLVERSGMRGKVDKELRGNNCHFYRARMDIRHCYIPKLPGVINPGVINASPVEGIALGEDDTAAGVVSTDLINPDPDTGVVSTDLVVENKMNDIKIDNQVSQMGMKKVIIMAKHLCGVATDLALRSLETFIDHDKDSNNILDSKVKGVSIATCCHHACVWRDYTGANWLLTRGFTSAEFDIMKLWSGWAHTLRTTETRRKNENTEKIEKNEESKIDKNEKNENENNGPSGENIDINDIENNRNNEIEAHTIPKEINSVIRPKNIDYVTMAKTGKMVKRIIDHGRVEYLRNIGLKTKQLKYCDELYSPECVMIIGTK
jgi:hypothetical protein